MTGKHKIAFIGFLAGSGERTVIECPLPPVQKTLHEAARER